MVVLIQFVIVLILLAVFASVMMGIYKRAPKRKK